MEKVKSADGTTIAFDQLGEGPPLVLVAGASCDRSIDAPLATVLAEDFTVLNYDRRGRGDSDDTLPFAVEREVEDIDVLLAAAGGSATLVGLSSGAALAAEAAAHGLSIDTLVMWEPPFSVDADRVRRAKEYADELDRLLATGRRGDALAHFMRFVGLPEEMIDGDASIAVLGAGRESRSDAGVRRRGDGRLHGPGRAVRTDRRAHARPGRLGEPRVHAHGRDPSRRRDTRRPPRGARGTGPQRGRRGVGACAGEVPGRAPAMITGVGLVCVWVLDIDEARDFYVGTLGFDVSFDMERDGFHWLVVHAPTQPEVPIMLVVPGPPAVDDATAEQLRSLVATGYLGPGALATDDCWATYRELEAKGVEFIEKPEERFYGIDAAFRDPFGNHWRLTQPKPVGPEE